MEAELHDFSASTLDGYEWSLLEYILIRQFCLVMNIKKSV